MIRDIEKLGFPLLLLISGVLSSRNMLSSTIVLLDVRWQLSTFEIILDDMTSDITSHTPIFSPLFVCVLYFV